MLAAITSITGMPQDPNKALANNLARLMNARAMSQVALAAKSGVGQTTISALINYRNETDSKATRMDTLARIAKALDVEAWMLLIPDMPIDVLGDKRVIDVIDGYVEAGPEGRRAIQRVAEQEARYQTFSSGQEKVG